MYGDRSPIQSIYFPREGRVQNDCQKYVTEVFSRLNCDLPQQSTSGSKNIITVFNPTMNLLNRITVQSSIIVWLQAGTTFLHFDI